jgi:hypothetical protein
VRFFETLKKLRIIEFRKLASFKPVKGGDWRVRRGS